MARSKKKAEEQEEKKSSWNSFGFEEALRTQRRTESGGSGSWNSWDSYGFAEALNQQQAVERRRAEQARSNNGLDTSGKVDSRWWENLSDGYHSFQAGAKDTRAKMAEAKKEEAAKTPAKSKQYSSLPKHEKAALDAYFEDGYTSDQFKSLQQRYTMDDLLSMYTAKDWVNQHPAKAKGPSSPSAEEIEDEALQESKAGYRDWRRQQRGNEKLKSGVREVNEKLTGTLQGIGDKALDFAYGAKDKQWSGFRGTLDYLQNWDTEYPIKAAKAQRERAKAKAAEAETNEPLKEQYTALSDDQREALNSYFEDGYTSPEFYDLAHTYSMDTLLGMYNAKDWHKPVQQEQQEAEAAPTVSLAQQDAEYLDGMNPQAREKLEAYRAMSPEDRAVVESVFRDPENATDEELDIIDRLGGWDEVYNQYIMQRDTPSGMMDRAIDSAQEKQAAEAEEQAFQEKYQAKLAEFTPEEQDLLLQGLGQNADSRDLLRAYDKFGISPYDFSGQRAKLNELIERAGGKEEAQNMVKAYTQGKNKQHYSAMETFGREVATANNAIGALYGRAVNAASTIGSASEMVSKWLGGVAADPYSGYAALRASGQGADQVNLEAIAEAYAGDPTAQRNLTHVYNAITQSADNVVRNVLLGQYGLAFMGMDAYNRAWDEMVEDGIDTRRATAVAMLKGAAEVGTELIPFDTAMKSLAGESTIKDLLIGFFGEVTGEELSELIGDSAEASILMDDSGYQQRVFELMRGGMTAKDAQERADREYRQKYIDIAVETILSTGVSEAVEYGIGRAMNPSADSLMPTDEEAQLQAAREADMARAAEYQRQEEERVARDAADREAEAAIAAQEAGAVPPSMQSGGASNKIAEMVLGDPEALAAVEKAAGEQMPDGLTESQQRAWVKEKLNQQAENRNPSEIPNSSQEAEASDGVRQNVGSPQSAQSADSAPRRGANEGAETETAQEGSTYKEHMEAEKRKAALEAQTDEDVQDNIQAAIEDLKLSSSVARPVIENGYDAANGLTANEYAVGVRQAYRYGQNGMFEDAHKDPISGKLPENVITAAFNAGRRARGDAISVETAKLRTMAARKAETGAVFYQGDTTKFSAVQRAGYDTLRSIAGQLNKDFYLYESTAEQRAAGMANGWIDPEGTIHIDINSGKDGKGTILFTAAHELTHDMKDNNPGGFQELQNFLFEQYGQKGQSVEELVQAQLDKMKGDKDFQSLSDEEQYDVAVEEVVASSMENLFTQEDTLQKLTQIRNQNPGLWERIKSFISEMAQKVREAYKGLRPDSKEGQRVAEMKDAMDELENLFTRGLDQAAKNREAAQARMVDGQKNTTPEGWTRYSISRTKNMTLQEQLKDYYGGNLKSSDSLYFGETPDSLNVVGLDSLPLAFRTTDFNKSTKEKHNVPRRAIKNLNSSLSNAVLAFSDGERIGVLTQDIDADGKPLLVGIQKNVSMDNAKVNAIRSVYGLDNPQEWLKNQLESGKDFYLLNENKANSFLRPYGYLASREEGISSIAPIVPQSAPGSQEGIRRKSRRDQPSTDSEGRELSEGQQAYFQDSKVRDENGSLKVVYHGSPAQFTEFSYDFLNTHGSSEGRGFYFTDSKSMAEGYRENGGSLMEGYLDIQKPLSNDRVTMKRAELKKLIQTIDKTGDDIVANYDSSGVGYPSRAWYNRALAETVDAIYDAAESDADILGELAHSGGSDGDILQAVREKLGYDGFITEGKYGNDTVYVAFASSQFKNADNQNPTDSPDIRYQKRQKTSAQEAAALARENAKLQQDLEDTKALLKLQKEVTGGTVIDKGSVQRAARRVMKKYNAGGNALELAPMVMDIYNYLTTAENPTIEGINETADAAAEYILDNLKPTKDPYAGEVLDQMKGQHIRLNAEQLQEANSIYGSMRDFRRAIVGTVVLDSTNGTPLDSWWQEMSATYPNLFDADTNANDMPGTLVQMVDTLRSMQSTAADEFGPDAVKRDIIQDLYDEFWNVSTVTTVADRWKGKVDALKSRHKERMDALRAEKNETIAKVKQEKKEAVKAARKDRMDSLIQQQKDLTQKFREQRKAAVEGREKTAIRHKIMNTVKALNQLLVTNTGAKHVPDALKLAVTEALDAVDFEWDSQAAARNERYTAKVAALQAELARATDPSDIERLSKQLSSAANRNRSLDRQLERMQAAYAAIKNSTDPAIAEMHDEVIANKIEEVQQLVGTTPLREMNRRQLEAVHELYTAVLTNVRDANKLHAENLKAGAEATAQKVQEELKAQDKGKRTETGLKRTLSREYLNNLKPEYFFKHLKSETLQKVYRNLQNGQEKWAVISSEAKELYSQAAEKYGFRSWDFNQKHEFTSANGQTFQLSLQDIMSLYAYAKRDNGQGRSHITQGGIVLDQNTKRGGKLFAKFSKGAEAYSISDATLDDIIGTLTPEQRGFVDETQAYLSGKLADYGNEVSTALYGIKLFNEQNYFPLKSSAEYLPAAQKNGEKNPRIKNWGSAKSLVEGASNPIVLSEYSQTWGNHVEEMARYAALTLAEEDFYRVWNYKSQLADGTGRESVRASIENAYGKEAADYIDTLLNDVNGGMKADPREGFLNKMTGKMKAAAVGANLSVVAKQYGAVLRASAYIDLKYFAGRSAYRETTENGKRMKQWEELKKYAPVAIIKEMGYFDVGLGRTGADWVIALDKQGLGEKVKGVFTDADYRNELIGWAPGKMDELGWGTIWEAAKRETKAKTGLTGEELLKAAGRRFTEVVNLTQVYDSTFSRSANMRSKAGLAKMATAFMAEPTVNLNMLEHAADLWNQGQRGQALRQIRGIYLASAATALMAGFVGGGRDDDEDKTLLEKYLAAVAGNLADDALPLNWIPYVKDIVSQFQGYTVERTDMTVSKKIVKAFQAFGSDKKDPVEKALGIVGAMSDLWGIPVNNVMRDIKMVGNAMRSTPMEKENWRGIWYAVSDELPGLSKSKQEKLIETMVDGDDLYLGRIEDTYRTDSAFNTAVKKAVQAGWADGDITRAEAVELLKQYHDAEKAESNVTLWENKARFQEEHPDYDWADGQITKFYSTAKPAGISAEVFDKYLEKKGNATSQKVIFPIINSLPITKKQKDTLYYMNGWSKNTINKAPWH